jgi:copper chaperone CopZ
MPETRFNVGMTWYVLLTCSWQPAETKLLLRYHLFTFALIPCFLSFLLRLRDMTWHDAISCSEGCAAAVKRILGKVDGVTDIQTDVAAKSVVVQHGDAVSPADLNDKLQKVRSRWEVTGDMWNDDDDDVVVVVVVVAIGMKLTIGLVL